MFYLVNEYVFGYEEEEEEVEPGAETAAPSIALSANQAEGGVEGTEAPELDQVEELLVQVPDKPPEGAIFIPLWWGKKSSPTPYKTSDPEWQGYVKLAKDPRRMEEVKGKTDELDLVSMEANPEPRIFVCPNVEPNAHPMDKTAGLSSPN